MVTTRAAWHGNLVDSKGIGDFCLMCVMWYFCRVNNEAKGPIRVVIVEMKRVAVQRTLIGARCSSNSSVASPHVSTSPQPQSSTSSQHAYSASAPSNADGAYRSTISAYRAKLSESEADVLERGAVDRLWEGYLKPGLVFTFFVYVLDDMHSRILAAATREHIVRAVPQ